MNHPLAINHRIAIRRQRPTQRQLRIERPVLIEINHAQPVRPLHDTEAELLVATTHAGAWARRFLPARVYRLGGLEEARHEPLVVHSSRERRDMHEVLLASCYLPVLHAGVARVDGALHVDGALADNTLIDALAARGATEITVVTPFAGGAVARTMFSTEDQFIVEGSAANASMPSHELVPRMASLRR